MQLAGPGVWGPPRDPDGAAAVLREAVATGVNQNDTSDYNGPVTAVQIEEARRITPIVCVQNSYNLADRRDDAMIDDLARQGIAYVPFFPLGGFTPLHSTTLSNVAGRLGFKPFQVALAWLLHRSPNILLIPGTSSVAHLRENLAAGRLTLSAQVLAELDGIASGNG
jgi:aryl-alcohol dehydrogenase-like predicted oxidoreductase